MRVGLGPYEAGKAWKALRNANTENGKTSQRHALAFNNKEGFHNGTFTP